MGTLLQDLRFALRTLRRTPAFPLAAIGTLAIGIGATTAIFSTVNAALLKPLPYPDPNDLYSIRTTLTDGRVTTGNVAPVEIVRLNDPSLSIVHAVGLQGNDVTLLRDDGTPLKTRAYAVSDGFFELFGLPMTLGGVPKDVPTGNAPPSVIVSYRMWQDLYGGDPAVVGKPIRFAEITTTVAGVAPREFDTPHDANFWFQIRLDPQGVNHSFEGFMRVKPGTTIERARSEMEAVMASVARDFPASATARVYVVRPLVESIVGELGPILVVVLSATGLLLVLACVNVTNLLLARGAARGREMAVRVALGAARGRIVRQLLTESILLATAGAVVGVSCRVRIRALAVDDRCVSIAPPRYGVLRRARIVVRAGRADRERRAGRVRAGAAACVDRRQDLDEREWSVVDKRAGHHALAERADDRRSRACRHARGWCGLARSQLRQPANHGSRLCTRRSGCVRRLGHGSEVPRQRRRPCGVY